MMNPLNWSKNSFQGDVGGACLSWLVHLVEGGQIHQFLLVQGLVVDNDQIGVRPALRVANLRHDTLASLVPVTDHEVTIDIPGHLEFLSSQIDRREPTGNGTKEEYA